MKHLKQYLGPVVAVILAITILLGMNLLLQAPSVGQAITTPLIAPLDLEAQESYDIDTTINPSWKITLRLSGVSRELLENVEVTTTLQGDLLKYKIHKGTETYAEGLLSNTFPSTEGMYVNVDEKADLELRYAPPVVTIKNLNYISPDATTFKLLNANFQEISSPAIYVANGSSVTFYVNATSSSAPQLRASFSEQLPANISMNGSGNTFSLLQLSFIPQQAVPYHFTVSGLVGTKNTTKSYVFASNGILYVLQDAHYPELVMKLHPTQGLSSVALNFTFPAISQLQPFSLPCSLSPQPVSLFGQAVVYSYGVNGITTAWLANPAALSDLTHVQPLQGYVLRLQNAVAPSVIPLSCSLATPSLPSLAAGWNLIGIVGYEAVSQSMLTERVPAGKRITSIYEVQRGGANLLATTIVPGKAYWVYVE